MSLSELKAGNTAIVETILGGRHIRQKLVNFGMIPGSEIYVVRANRLGPMVLTVQGAQIMLGAGMTKRINVRKK